MSTFATKRYTKILDEAEQIHGESLGQQAWRRLRKDRFAMLSLAYLIFIVLVSVFTYLLPLQSPRKVDTLRHFRSPSLSLTDTLEIVDDKGAIDETKLDRYFGRINFFDSLCVTARIKLFGNYCVPSVCGTDKLGRDVLARVVHGARVSLMVGFVATLVSVIIGVTYGAVSGYMGGWVDNVMMRFVDILYSIPFLFVVIFIITILDAPDIKSWLIENHINRIHIFFVLIGLVFWITMARVVRGQVLSLKNEQFVEAARALGAGPMRIIFRHIIPNLFSIVIVYLTLTIPSVMLFEAFLSFLGIGVEPPNVSWGSLATEGYKVITPLVIYWWLVLFPGLALATTLFALNFLGDGLRDALDPRLKNR